VNNTYFQYYSLLIFLVSAATMIAVSYMTEAPAIEKLRGLTFGTIPDADRQRTRSSWDWRDVAASVLVILIILCAYLYFNG